jgi:hypothetical protein
MFSRLKASTHLSRTLFKVLYVLRHIHTVLLCDSSDLQDNTKV